LIFTIVRFFSNKKDQTLYVWNYQSWSQITSAIWFYNHWEYGANYVVSIFHQHLSDLNELIAAEKWSHTLFLQIDNCWRKNKNTTMMKYLGLLLKFGWFKHIELYILTSGHIHEDIDQMFSTWNVHY
jgi:hypothetical protein